VTAYFFDSSALLKRYVTEIGSGWVRSTISLRSGNTIFVAQITSAELVSALMRRRREGTIPSRTARASRLLIDRHIRREYQMVRLSDRILFRAEDLLEAYPLRAADALQLASAVELSSRISLVFVSADIRLTSTATIEGLQTDDPNTYP
jgi:uncharacterized protein